MEVLIERWTKLRSQLPPGANLLAVSKGHPSSSIRILAELGQRDFGESRLQEALSKIQDLEDLDWLRWHFVGRIQANKVRGIIRHFSVVHSVDSLKLAERISRISREENKTPEIMLQVKFLEDPSKGGFKKDQLVHEWYELNALPNLQITGLMTIPPIGLDLKGRLSLFKECRELANSLDLKGCSMGMTRDWQEALEAGSTWLRMGSGLFGERLLNVNRQRDITKST